MKLSELTENQVREATAAVRREVRQCEAAAISGDRGTAYAAAERAEQAAHDLKQLFALTAEEIEKVLKS